MTERKFTLPTKEEIGTPAADKVTRDGIMLTLRQCLRMHPKTATLTNYGVPG